MAKHIKILGKGNLSILLDKDSISNFLNEVCNKIKLISLGEPIIHNIPFNSDNLDNNNFMNEGGVTGVLVLNTSHCAVHTWPLKQEFNIDIYSCKEFNKEVAVKFVSDFFQCYKMKVSDLTSTTNW